MAMSSEFNYLDQGLLLVAMSIYFFFFFQYAAYPNYNNENCY